MYSMHQAFHSYSFLFILCSAPPLLPFFHLSYFPAQSINQYRPRTNLSHYPSNTPRSRERHQCCRPKHMQNCKLSNKAMPRRRTEAKQWQPVLEARRAKVSDLQPRFFLYIYLYIYIYLSMYIYNLFHYLLPLNC